MTNIKRIGKEVFEPQLRTEFDAKLDSNSPVSWEQITGKPPLADSAWKTPVNTPADLPMVGNFNGDVRLTLDEGWVFSWDESRQQWMLIGANAMSMDWSAIDNKPLTFPPSVHTHLWVDITDKPTSFTPITHTHAWIDVTDKPSSFPPSTHTHSKGDIIDWDAITEAEADVKISTRAPLVHTHAMSDITGLPSSLDNKVDKIVGKGLSDLNFSLEDKTRLDSLNNNASVDYQSMLDAHNEHVGNSTIHVTQLEKDEIAKVASKVDKTYVDTGLASKAEKSTFEGHTSNSTVHITGTERTIWNAKVDKTYVDSELQKKSISIGAVQPTGVEIWYKVVE